MKNTAIRYHENYSEVIPAREMFDGLLLSYEAEQVQEKQTIQEQQTEISAPETKKQQIEYGDS